MTLYHKNPQNQQTLMLDFLTILLSLSLDGTQIYRRTVSSLS